MDNGITAGLNLLNKMLDSEPNGEAKKDVQDIDQILSQDKKYLTRKKHFKITQTTEGEMTDDDNIDEESFKIHKTNKHRQWNCFGSCIKPK